MTFDQGFRFDRFFTAFRLRPGFSLADIPDTVILRLKNLIALDANGNDLHIGSNILKVPNYLITGTNDPGINELSVIIYPNPANQSISIETELESDCNIINLQGQVVKMIPESDIHKPIDISNLSPGFYILQMLETGRTFKFIKQ